MLQNVLKLQTASGPQSSWHSNDRGEAWRHGTVRSQGGEAWRRETVRSQGYVMVSIHHLLFEIRKSFNSALNMSPTSTGQLGSFSNMKVLLVESVIK